jgi:hypothetical protein
LKSSDPFASKPPRGKTTNAVTNDQFHPHTLLEQARQSLLRSLVDLVAEGRKLADPYRHQAEEILKKILDIEQAQRDIAPEPSNKYGRHKRAIEAILDYLAERGRPASEQEICVALLQGGFRGGDAGAEDDIAKSFRSFITGTGRKTVEKNPERGIKSLKGMVGIASWPDSYWDK